MGEVVRVPEPPLLPDVANIAGAPPDVGTGYTGRAVGAFRDGWLNGWFAAWRAAVVWHETAVAVEPVAGYVHRLLDAWASGAPLDFGGEYVPPSVQTRVADIVAAAKGTRPAEPAAERRSEPPDEDSMLAQVERDLARMKGLDSGVRGSLAMLGKRLARRLDECDASTSETAYGGLAQQLRTTLTALTEVGTDGTLANALFDRLSAPVRDAADADPEDVGAAHGSGSSTVGQAAVAVAAGSGRRGVGSDSGSVGAEGVAAGVRRFDVGSDASAGEDGVPIPADDA